MDDLYEQCQAFLDCFRAKRNSLCPLCLYINTIITPVPIGKSTYSYIKVFIGPIFT